MTTGTSDTLTAVRNLVADWKRDGVAEFDTAAEVDSPLKVAEAARQLRCAWELERVLAIASHTVDVAQPASDGALGSQDKPERVREVEGPLRLHRMITVSREIVRAAIHRSIPTH